MRFNPQNKTVERQAKTLTEGIPVTVFIVVSAGSFVAVLQEIANADLGQHEHPPQANNGALLRNQRAILRSALLADRRRWSARPGVCAAEKSILFQAISIAMIWHRQDPLENPAEEHSRAPGSKPP